MLSQTEVSSQASTASLRVLVIDDEPAMRQIIRALLRRVGIENVHEADGGEEALAILEHARSAGPDIIISDLHMKNMDGIEFCKRARQNKDIHDRGVPILILTGGGDELLHEAAQRVGAAAVLTKPISANDLLQHIRIAIGFSGGTNGGGGRRETSSSGRNDGTFPPDSQR